MNCAKLSTTKPSRCWTGFNEQAIAAFTALADYGQSADYLNKATYQLGASHLEKKEYEQAAGLFLGLGAYLDASERYREAQHALALAALNSGDIPQAIALLEPIRDYKNAGELYDASVYQQATTEEAAGNLGEAARLYGKIPLYKDAAQKSGDNYTTYFETAYRAAKEGMSKKDYKAVIDALEGLDRSNTGEAYQDIPQMYQEAAYRYADELYKDKKPYEALAYYRKIPDYKDVSTKKITRTPYQIIGSWRSQKGAEFIFRDDGSCLIEGKEMYYYARQYLLQVGSRPDELNISYNIVYLRPKALSLRHMGNQTLYKCERLD